MHTRHKHTTSTWRNTHTSHTRAPTAPRLTIQTENTTSITSPPQKKHISTLQGSNPHYFQQRPLHNKHSHRPPHSHYNRDNTKLRHMHASTVSWHIATRGNNKILRTPPVHISSTKEILPRINCRTLAQLRTNLFPFLKSYLHKVDAKTHPPPLCPLCNTHTNDTHHLFKCTHIQMEG